MRHSLGRWLLRARSSGAMLPVYNRAMTAPVTRWDNDHDRLDEIRRQCHIAIAAKIDADRTLLAVPKRNILRWAEQTGTTPPALAEWSGVLDRPWPEIRRILVSSDDNATRLRQSTPFTGILSQRERYEIRGTVPA